MSFFIVLIILFLGIVGSLLADLSVSQSEDDLDSREMKGAKEWRKHRPSFPRESGASSAKKRRSETKEKTVDVSSI